MAAKHPPGQPITLGNMRQLRVRGLVVACLDPQCHHEAIIGADDYADEIEVTSFAARMVCSKCGSKRVRAAKLEENADSTAGAV